MSFRPEIDMTTPVTPEWVRVAVTEIAKSACDDEVAHLYEDQLHKRVLAAISKRECADPSACATEALKTVELDFARWCA